MTPDNMPITPAECEQNKEIACAFLAAIAAGDLNSIERLLHPQLRWWVLGFGELDRSTFISSLGATIAMASKRTLEIVGVTAEADRVAVEAAGRFHMAETVYANTYHYLFVIDSGQILVGKEYLDTLEAKRVFSSNKGVVASN